LSKKPAGFVLTAKAGEIIFMQDVPIPRTELIDNIKLAARALIPAATSPPAFGVCRFKVV
jgi:hypothetical protein